MAKSITYTNRYEVKYLVSSKNLNSIEESFKGILISDKNSLNDSGYYNHTIYFDTPHLKFYREKQEGLLTRTKPRIRIYKSYPKGPAIKAYVEIKKKFDRIVQKDRSEVDVSATSTITGNILELCFCQDQEKESAIQQFNLL